jgi:ABC-type bacteriocin/lantibiotic exporter with double-glycine peptidase domain
MVGLDEDIEQMAMGMHTVISDGASTFSGGQRQRIMIAHRLSSIVNADRVIVLEAGRIVQDGTYAELLAQPGLFQDLVGRQIA